jgi:uncharacterized membrane protein YdbT with pleckstrin-like domain
MSYLRSVLQPGETVVYATRLHWFVYLPAVGFLILTAAALVLASAFNGSGDQGGEAAALIAVVAACVFALFALIAWVRGMIRRRSTELAATDRRVIYKRGLIQRHTIEINRTKVESVDVDQSIAGRIFGYGTVTIRGTGGGLEPLRNISAPLVFRNYITAQ